MKLLKNKNFYKFLIPSLIGIILFVLPIKQDGQFTIPIAVMAHGLLDLIGDHSLLLIWILVSLSFILTAIHKLFPVPFIKKSEKLNGLFDVSWFWFSVRLIGFVFVNMLFFDFGPELIIGEVTGAVVALSLMPILVCVFFLAGLLLALLLNYGLLDFFGSLMIRVMRPLFNLPGRSALDCIASWLGDGSIGVLLTSKQYEEGFYSKREATVIATTFSAVSITFCLVVITEVGLEHLFLPFYLVVSIAGIVAAIIVPKLPPLSRIPDTYCTKSQKEDIPVGTNPFRYGMKRALKKAEDAPGIKGFLFEGIGNVLEMWIGTLPVILCFGTIALIIAEYTPVFEYLGVPFIPVYKLLQIPEAKLASETVVVGFADMFLPSVLANSIQSELTRFVVAATSVTQLIYMSEIGSIIMGSKIRVSLGSLFVIFIEKTIVTLPVIALFAHLML